MTSGSMGDLEVEHIKMATIEGIQFNDEAIFPHFERKKRSRWLRWEIEHFLEIGNIFEEQDSYITKRWSEGIAAMRLEGDNI